mmetsp:Transcript_27662/g.40821  ORF Transcript_27662/g.40821 Transcript_27662/m.40821 type:complete len:83 (+) Transcript_27662:406-654(+)
MEREHSRVFVHSSECNICPCHSSNRSIVRADKFKIQSNQSASIECMDPIGADMIVCISVDMYHTISTNTMTKKITVEIELIE